MTEQTVLFLCTGNYYRSRMAEEMLNHLAEQRSLPMRSVSRGLLPSFEGNGNVGSFSPSASKVLRERGIQPRRADEFPQSVTADELHRADWVIALYRRQHEAMIAAQFPEFQSKVVYWDVPDLDEMPADQAGELVYRQVVEFLALAGSGHDAHPSHKLSV